MTASMTIEEVRDLQLNNIPIYQSDFTVLYWIQSFHLVLYFDASPLPSTCLIC
ncbi:hypothetical protein Cal6303_0808 [Calothrix sp. PCC 6303]|nr:hypothetical protein Cal6303_0808 [Calothrix sp. PCC 6303]